VLVLGAAAHLRGQRHHALLLSAQPLPPRFLQHLAASPAAVQPAAVAPACLDQPAPLLLLCGHPGVLGCHPVLARLVHPIHCQHPVLLPQHQPPTAPARQILHLLLCRQQPQHLLSLLYHLLLPRQ
jgi:hypothetical protein